MFFSRLLILILLVASTLFVSPPVHAATPTIDEFSCEQTGSTRWEGTFSCFVSASGHTGGYTWTKQEGTHAPGSWTTSLPQTSSGCPYRVGIRMSVTVRDSTGATASASTYVMCYGGTPGV